MAMMTFANVFEMRNNEALKISEKKMKALRALNPIPEYQK